MKFSYKINKNVIMIAIFLLMVMSLFFSEINITVRELIAVYGTITLLKSSLFIMIGIWFIQHKMYIFNIKTIYSLENMMQRNIRMLNIFILSLGIFTFILDMVHLSNQDFTSSFGILIVYSMLEIGNEFWIGDKYIIYKNYLVFRDDIIKYDISDESQKHLFISYIELKLHTENKVINIKIPIESVSSVKEFLQNE